MHTSTSFVTLILLFSIKHIAKPCKKTYNSKKKSEKNLLKSQYTNYILHGKTINIKSTTHEWMKPRAWQSRRIRVNLIHSNIRGWMKYINLIDDTHIHSTKLFIHLHNNPSIRRPPCFKLFFATGSCLPRACSYRRRVAELATEGCVGVCVYCCCLVSPGLVEEDLSRDTPWGGSQCSASRSSPCATHTPRRHCPLLLLKAPLRRYAPRIWGVSRPLPQFSASRAWMGLV